MAARANSEIWRKRIEAHRNSDLTAVNWCKINNLKIATFRYWVTRLNKEKNKPKQEWISIENTIPAAPVVPITIKIGKISVEVPDTFNHETLHSVLKVLRIND